jgi:hypothetical protein
MDSNSRAMEAIRLRERRLELLQSRMQALFPGSEAQTQQESDQLPPPIPRPGAAQTPPRPAGSAHSSPNRRTDIRQARNSPGGSRVRYSLDPDFDIEESDESSADEAADGTTAQGPATREEGIAAVNADDNAIDLENIRRIDDTTAALRNLLRFGTPDEINAASDAMPARTSSSVRRTPGSDREARQQMRLARMSQRAEEEAALNRAILMSLQENQTADRRTRSGDAAAGDEGGASAAPAESDIAMLESMGFTREQSVQALLENRLNVELAANRLLGLDF